MSWYCEYCHNVVPDEHVTYSEHHDPRCGGCGYAVEPLVKSIENKGDEKDAEIARLREELADARRVLECLWTNRGVRMVSDDMQRVLNAAGIDPFEDDSEQW